MMIFLYYDDDLHSVVELCLIHDSDDIDTNMTIHYMMMVWRPSYHYINDQTLHGRM